MARLGKVVKFKPAAAGTTIAGSGKSSSEPTLIKKISDALDELPTRILETPYPIEMLKRLESAIRICRMTPSVLEEVEAGKTSPKRAGLIELRNAAQALRCKLKRVKLAHRNLITSRMVGEADRRSEEETIVTGWGYAQAADTINRGGLNVDVIAELLESALDSLCDEKPPMTMAQARKYLREEAVWYIHQAFSRAGYRLNRANLTAVVRVLARYFPTEADLASVSVSTVRDIVRDYPRAK